MGLRFQQQSGVSGVFWGELTSDVTGVGDRDGEGFGLFIEPEHQAEDRVSDIGHDDMVIEDGLVFTVERGGGGQVFGFTGQVEVGGGDTELSSKSVHAS